MNCAKCGSNRLQHIHQSTQLMIRDLCEDLTDEDGLIVDFTEEETDFIETTDEWVQCKNCVTDHDFESNDLGQDRIEITKLRMRCE